MRSWHLLSIAIVLGTRTQTTVHMRHRAWVVEEAHADCDGVGHTHTDHGAHATQGVGG
jgi:hypothetical protein